jgi:hypothetical protein
MGSMMENEMECGVMKYCNQALGLLLLCLFIIFSSATSGQARFITPDTWDPMLLDVDINRYAYSGNDPINQSDPNGHQAIESLTMGCVSGGCQSIGGGLTLMGIGAGNVAGPLVLGGVGSAYLGTSLGERSIFNAITTAKKNGWDPLALNGVNSYSLGSQTDQNLLDGIKTHEWQIKDHERKLREYLADPDLYDNKGRLKEARTPAERNKIIAGRAKTLQDTIERQKREAEKKRAELERRRKEREEKDSKNDKPSKKK